MRLYAVITPPADVVADLARVVDQARVAAPELPWTEPAMWSLRLARFGNLGLVDLTTVKETLVEIGTYCPPLTLQLSGAGAQPQESDADELDIGMAGSIDEVWSLARTIPAMVQRHGLFLDRRSFRAAVTVAQGAQEPFDPTAALDVLAAYLGPEWTAGEMRLVRLVPSDPDVPGIGDYEDIARYAFTAPPEPTPGPGTHRAD